MTRFLFRRAVGAVATLWLLSLITFLLGALAPGGPAEVLLGQHADPAAVRALNHEFGLDRPLPERYVTWLTHAVRGDLGVSFRDRQPVAPTLMRRYPVTVQLACFAAVLALAVGIPLGLAGALKPDTWVDRLSTTTALACVSLPTFVLLPLLVLIFALKLRWSPVTYEGQWIQLTLPALALGLRPSALLARITRGAFLEALSQDYVRTARAKGVSWVRTVLIHAGKNALVPVLTVFGTSVGYMLGGSFVVETLFGVPGVGELSVASIPARDYPMIQAVVLLAAAAFILVNLLVDLIYGLLDPRLRATS